MSLSEAQYRAVAPVLTDGQLSLLRVDSTGALVTAGGQASGSTASTVNPIQVAGVYTAGDPTFTNGQQGALQIDSRGSLHVTIGSSGSYAATNGAFADAISNSTPNLVVGGYIHVFNGTTWDRMRGDVNGTYTVPKPVTSGGLSIARLVGATSGVIKASAGQLYTGMLTNTNAAIRFLQIYNKATAGVLSTDTPVMTVPLPPNIAVPINFSDIGGAFSTGISWQFTTDNVAIPTTAGASTDLHGFINYK